MDIIVLDHELASGNVSLEAFKALWEAECYGTATPMQWLEARLLILEHAGVLMERWVSKTFFVRAFSRGTVD